MHKHIDKETDSYTFSTDDDDFKPCRNKISPIKNTESRWRQKCTKDAARNTLKLSVYSCGFLTSNS